MRLPAGDPKWPMTRVFTRFAVEQTLDLWPLMTFKGSPDSSHLFFKSMSEKVGSENFLDRVKFDRR